MKVKDFNEQNKQCLKDCYIAIDNEVDFAIINEFGERKSFQTENNNYTKHYIREYLKFANMFDEHCEISFDLDDILYR